MKESKLDINNAETIAWIPLSQARQRMADGEIVGRGDALAAQQRLSAFVELVHLAYIAVRCQPVGQTREIVA